MAQKIDDKRSNIFYKYQCSEIIKQEKKPTTDVLEIGNTLISNDPHLHRKKVILFLRHQNMNQTLLYIPNHMLSYDPRDYALFIG